MELSLLPPEALLIVTRRLLADNVAKLLMCGSRRLTAGLLANYGIDTIQFDQKRAGDCVIPPLLARIKRLRHLSITLDVSSFRSNVIGLDLLKLPNTLETLEITSENGEDIYWSTIRDWENSILESGQFDPSSSSSGKVPALVDARFELPPGVEFPFPKLKVLRLGKRESSSLSMFPFYMSSNDIQAAEKKRFPAHFLFPPALETLELRTSKLPTSFYDKDLPQTLKHLTLHGEANIPDVHSVINWQLRLPKTLKLFSYSYPPFTVSKNSNSNDDGTRGEAQYNISIFKRVSRMQPGEYFNFIVHMPSLTFADALQQQSQPYNSLLPFDMNGLDGTLARLSMFSFIYPPCLTHLDSSVPTGYSVALNADHILLLPRTVTCLRAAFQRNPPVDPVDLLRLPDRLLHLYIVKSALSSAEHIKSLPKGLQTLEITGDREFDPASFQFLPPSLKTLNLDLKQVSDLELGNLPRTITELNLGESATFSSHFPTIIAIRCPLLTKATFRSAWKIGDFTVPVVEQPSQRSPKTKRSKSSHSTSSASSPPDSPPASPKERGSKGQSPERSRKKKSGDVVQSVFQAYAGTGYTLSTGATPSSSNDYRVYDRSHYGKAKSTTSSSPEKKKTRREDLSEGSRSPSKSSLLGESGLEKVERSGHKKQNSSGSPKSGSPLSKEFDSDVAASLAFYDQVPSALKRSSPTTSPGKARASKLIQTPSWTLFTPHLTYLDLKYNQKFTDSDIALLPRTLVHFDLSWNSILSTKCSSHFPPNLTTLNLAAVTKFTDKAIANLPRTLMDLNLASAAQVTGSSFSSLPPLLTSLNLRNSNTVFDANLKDLPRGLTHLILYSAVSVTDKGLSSLPRFLALLDLSWNRSISDTGIGLLPRHLTDLAMHNTEKLTVAALPLLPRTLTSFSCASCFPSLESIRPSLPPQLKNFSYRS